MRKLYTLLFALLANTVLAQTSVQNFGSGTGSFSTSNGTSTSLLPNPTSGTTYVRISSGQGGSVALTNPGLTSLGTNTEMKAIASTGASVVKATPVYQYTSAKVFYTQFYILFGDNSGGTTASSGNWAFYQGSNASGTTFNNTSDFNAQDAFVSLRWTYGASGALTLEYNDASWSTISGCWNQGVVYKVEIMGNNQSAGTSTYTYGSTSETVPINTYDLWINGNLISDDLPSDGLANNTNINAITFIGQSSTSNVATLFADDFTIYNSIPSSITSGCTAPTTNASSLSASGTASTQTTINWSNGSGANRILVAKQNVLISGTPTNGTTYTANAAYGSGSTIATNEYVVYNGCSNSQTITGLTAGYGYDFKVFEYNCNSGNETYLSSGSTDLSVVTVPNTPGSFATDCGSNGDIALSWTLPAGGYNNIIIFARQGSAPSHTPSGNGNTTYTGANSNFGSATTYGTDKLVYSGTGTTVTVTGLTAGQTYYFRAYAYSATVYSAATSTVSQLSGVPNVTGVSVTPAVDKLTVNWTNPSSCFDEVLIIATDNASVSSVPTGDGSAYDATQFYHDDISEINAPSNEFIVFQGNASTRTIFGLINGTTYNIKIYVRKGTYWSSGVTTSGVPNFSNGDFRTRSSTSGNWNSTTLWQSYNAGTWSNTASFPSSSTASVQIRSGSTVTMNSAATASQVATLLIDAGGKLYCNQSTNQYFVTVFTQVICNGTIGNGATNDGISLNMEGNPCFIGGTGTCKIAALRKTNNTNTTTDLYIDMNIDFNIIGSNRTVIYNNQNTTAFNVTINAGNIVSTPSATGNVAMDGTTGSNGGTRTGTITVYGTLNVNGIFYMRTSNTSGNYIVDIKDGGKIYVDSISSNASGTGGCNLIIESNGWLNIYGSSAFYNFSTTNNTYTCNTGSLVEYSGSTAQPVESGISYAKLKYSGSNSKTQNGNLTVSGDLTVDAAIYDAGTSGVSLALGGNFTMQNSGTMASTNCKNNLTINCINNNTQTFNGGGNSFYCLYMNATKSSGSLSFNSANSNLYVDNDLTGNFTGTSVLYDNGNTFTIGGALKLGSATSSSSNFSFTGTMLFNFDIGGALSYITNTTSNGVTVAQLNNLSLIAISGALSNQVSIYPTGGGSTLYVKGNVLISNTNVSTVLISNNNNINVKGNWTDYSNAGFTEGTSTIILNGTSAQTITGAETFYNLQMNNSAGASIASTVIVSNILTLTSGIITTSTNELQVTNTAVGAVTAYGTSSYVNGNLRRTLSTTNNLVYDFPVGSASYYELATLKFTNTTGLGASPTVLAFFTSGLPVTGPNSSTCFINSSAINGMLNGGYWTITPSAYTNGTTTYDITLAERGYSNFSANASQLGIIKRHDNTFAWAGTNLSGGTSAQQGFHSNANSSIVSGVATCKRTGVKSFSEFGIGYSANTLPVELSTFTATAVDNKTVDLNWRTEAELNSNYFSVERSADGITFTSIGKVDAHGTSQVENNYSLVDETPLCGTAYYRLKEVDFDGAVSYSQIRSVNIQCETVSLYPNPVVNELHIQLLQTGNTEITIYKVDGSKAYHLATDEASTSLLLNIAHLAAGNYLLSINQNGNIQTQRFTKL